MNNKKIYEEIKKYNDVIGKDIIYKEAILEVLNINKNIDTIIINDSLIGKISIEELIFKIKKIKRRIELIIVTNKNKIEYKEKLFKFDVNKIYSKKQFNIKLIKRISQQKGTNQNKILIISNDFNQNNILIKKIEQKFLRNNLNSIIIKFYFNNSKTKIIHENNKLIKINLFHNNYKKIINIINENSKNKDNIIINIFEYKNLYIINKMIEYCNKNIFILNSKVKEIKIIKKIIKNNIKENNNYFFIQKKFKVSKQIVQKIFNSNKIFKRYNKLLNKIK